MKTIILLSFALIAHTQLIAQTGPITLYNASETCVNEFNNHMPSTQLGHEYLFKLNAPEQTSLECYLVNQLCQLPNKILGIKAKNKYEYIIRLHENFNPTDLLQYLKNKGIYGMYFTTQFKVTLDNNNSPIEVPIIK